MTVSRQVVELAELLAPVALFFDRAAAQRRAAGPDACDFIAGEPQEMPLDGYVEALRRWAVPQRPDWYAYKMSTSHAQAAASKALRERLELPFEPDDVFMTNGAISAIVLTLRVLCDPGDEVIIVRPPHFLYEPLIRTAGASAVRVDVAEDLDLDPDAVARAITPRTRAVIVNSPHNPTGKVYSTDAIRELASVLDAASDRHGRPIAVLSDEAYRQIVFDGRPFTSPAAFYRHTFVIYTYAKTLLTPGQRLGYVALAPDMPEKERIALAFMAAQLTGGWAYPNALLQHALEDLEMLTIDVGAMQARRDRMVEGLRGIGYDLHVPEATFYLLVRSPIPDDVAFVDLLAEEGVLTMHGSLLEAPGSFRLSLTASDDMVERSFPGFARAMERARGVAR